MTKKTIDALFEETGFVIEDVAERSGLPAVRIEAIALARWTPSPKEREKVAHAFGAAVDEVIWGHSMDPRNVRYRRFGLKEDF